MGRVWVWVLGMILAANTAAAGCVVVRVIDGDTVQLVCDGRAHRVRLLGYDTPEVSRPRCRGEAVAGASATQVLRRLVASGPVTGVRFQGRDRYGRDLADVAIAGRDVAAAMLAAGVARPYDGGQRQGWCG